MRYVALATDYDGTLAHDGVTSSSTIDALERLRKSGRKAVLVTGREMPDLERIFPRLDLFDRVVAENGALVYNPATKKNVVLADPPPAKFIDSLHRRGIPNMSVGEVIVALWRPYEKEALDAIREFGLELQVIFNKDAVMILPSGVNKRSGLVEALKELKISPHGVVGVGDAENDHAFLGSCECAVVVANAIPALIEKADFVTHGARGHGVTELIDCLLKNDLTEIAPRLTRHNIRLGKTDQGDVEISPFGTNALVCGQSGGGKSTLIAAIVERLMRKCYQVCLIDPEGDYEHTEKILATGDAKHAPSLDHLEGLLCDPDNQVAVNLVGVPVADRAELFGRILALVQEHRRRSGRPHFLIIDEAHHMFPKEWAGTQGDLPGDLGSVVLVTVHPDHVSPRALKNMNVVIALGKDPGSVIGEYCRAIGKSMPAISAGDLEKGEALVWFVGDPEPLHVKTERAQMAHDRHKRKYAQGELEEQRVFYFRGPDGRLNLRAQNLNMFAQIAEGVDDETWRFHLKRGDYSHWLRDAIKDEELADQVSTLEKDESLSSADSRSRIVEAIHQKYTVEE